MQRKGASTLEFEGKSMETETTIQSKLLNGRKAPVDQETLGSNDKNKSRRARIRELQSGIQVEILIIWVRLFEKENLQQSSADQ